ncbi:unnamed protein product [Lactuca saligna]|uniref:Uncharacterized protein n=1 Tax=Lactuca saligna TaxID=75948 RepID=A0AA35ZTQ0_LACSI|nr:unnamed protein product [Lactuca saligna]
MMILNNEYFGKLGFAHVAQDIFLLENQIPFVVLKVMLDLRIPDGSKEILNKFFNYLNYGEMSTREENVLKKKKPLHLLELYRSNFILLSCSLSLGLIIVGKWKTCTKKVENADEDWNCANRNQSFASVT